MANTKITTNVIADGAITSAKLDTNITISGNITGTLATAAQPNITSLGTLTALTGGTGDLNWDSGTLFVDSSANKVGIGLTSPADYYADQLVVSAPGEGGITIASTATSNNNYLLFADGTSGSEAYRGQIIYAHGSDTFSLSSAGDIVIDADGGDIYLNDGGTGRGQISMANTDLTIISATSDRDLIFKGVDGASVITALTLDMSDAGSAIFNGNVTIDGFTNEKYLTLRSGFAPEASGGVGLRAANHAASNRDGLAIYGHDGVSILTGQTERMRIDAAGDVGIGQTDPATTLHIGDGASHYVRIENAGSGDISSGYQIYRGSSVGMSLYDNPADNTTSLLCAGSLNINCGGSGADLHVNTNGKVGIGTTDPSEILHIVAGGSGPEVRLQNASGSHYIRAYNDNWNFLANASKTAMTIKNSGDILYPNQTFFSVKRSGNQTFANAAWVDVIFNSEITDTGANFASNVFTVPVAGVYLFTGLIAFTTIAATNYVLARIVCSSTGDFYITHEQKRSGGGDYGYDAAISDMITLSAGETVKIQVFAGSGGDHILRSDNRWQGRLMG